MRTLGIFICLGLSIGAFHWWKNVRPFFKVEGTLSVLSTEVKSEEAGRLYRCSLEEGDFFQTGQNLYSLDSHHFSLQIKEIERNLTLRRQESEQAKLKVDQTMQQYLYLQNELKSEGKTSELLDQILKEAREMQKHCFELEKETATLQNERTEIEKKIGKRSLAADFEGVVLHRFKQVGETVEAGESLYLVTNNQKRWVEAEIAETMLMKVRVGLPGTIEFPSYPKKKWTAQVSWISPIAKEGKLKIRLTADNLPFYSGLSAKVQIRAATS